MVDHDLIDPNEPVQSLLLQKPTMQIDHGGGLKMVVGDRSYKQFRRFIDDYAAIISGKYVASDQLPEEHNELSIVTDSWLKLEGVPAEFDKMLLQVDLYRQTNTGLSEHRFATADRGVFGGGYLWQQTLSMTAQRGSKLASEMASKQIPPGRYHVKLYLDQKGILQRDFNAALGENEFVGEVEIQSKWPTGYGQMTVIKFPVTQ
jgi:hypothetical protein